MDDTTTRSPRYPFFAVPNRTLAEKGSSNGVLTPFSLQEVFDHLKHLVTMQCPTDHERTLNQLHVDFADGHMAARWIDPRGLGETHYLVTSNGASQLASDVLPSRFFTGLKQLGGIDSQGEKLATMVWMKFASGCTDTPRRVRTVRMKFGSDIRWAIRSCHSLDYAPYSNMEFVTDILNNTGQFAHTPVLHWWVTDNGMRIRFMGLDPALAAFANMAPEVLLNEPIPMIEAWNSETGCRRTGLRGGMFRLKNATGIGHWNERMEYNWIHRGDPERIRHGVQDAFQNLFTVAAGVVDAYKQATNIAIDNAYKWMEEELYKVVSDRVLHVAQGALTDATVTPGGNLASVVDALALAAKSETDLFDQHEIERVASQMLDKGLAEGLKNGGRIATKKEV